MPVLIKKRVAWNKGIPRTNDDKKKISKTKKRRFKEGTLKSWNEGLTKDTSDSLKKMSDTLKEGYKNNNINCGFKKGHVISREHRAKLSKRMIDDNPIKHLLKEKHPNWRGGISNAPYAFEFNKKLKDQIKERDNFRCQECFRHKTELTGPLVIHHIDYNKKNTKKNNLITLCPSCHTQTNFNRSDWSNYFQDRIGGVH